MCHGARAKIDINIRCAPIAFMFFTIYRKLSFSSIDSCNVFHDLSKAIVSSIGFFLSVRAILAFHLRMNVCRVRSDSDFIEGLAKFLVHYCDKILHNAP